MRRPVGTNHRRRKPFPILQIQLQSCLSAWRHKPNQSCWENGAEIPKQKIAAVKNTVRGTVSLPVKEMKSTLKGEPLTPLSRAMPDGQRLVSLSSSAIAVADVSIIGASAAAACTTVHLCDGVLCCPLKTWQWKGVSVYKAQNVVFFSSHAAPVYSDHSCKVNHERLLPTKSIRTNGDRATCCWWVASCS